MRTLGGMREHIEDVVGRKSVASETRLHCEQRA